MQMTLAQVNGYARAASRREARRVEDMAVAMRAAGLSDQAWANFLKETGRG